LLERGKGKKRRKKEGGHTFETPHLPLLRKRGKGNLCVPRAKSVSWFHVEVGRGGGKEKKKKKKKKAGEWAGGVSRGPGRPSADGGRFRGKGKKFKAG